jgi:hypothetical protein
MNIISNTSDLDPETLRAELVEALNDIPDWHGPDVERRGGVSEEVRPETDFAPVADKETAN